MKHYGSCTGPRALDVTEHPEGVTVRHCVDCGAHEATSPSGELLPEPTATGPFAGDRPGVFDGITMERMENKR